MAEGNQQGGGQADSLIRFACNFCGQHIRIPKIHAGKKGKCPKCGKVVLIPTPPAPKQPQEDEPLRLKHEDSPPDFAVSAPAPGQSWHRGAVNPTDAVETDVLRSKAPAEPKSPATILNIFTFPFSLAGVIHFLIFWFGPFLLLFFSRLLMFTCYGSLLIIAANIVFYGYLYYYLANCVIAAAKDERLAPDLSSDETPGFLDLLRRVLLIIGSTLICFGPVIFYVFYFYIRPIFWFGREGATPNLQSDPIYWVLFGEGVLFFPMFLLAVAMFDSVTALNPVLIITSIISTLVPYCALALLFFGIGILMNYLGRFRLNWILFVLAWGADIYLMFIAAYILGRFFRRYESRLNWEVKL